MLTSRHVRLYGLSLFCNHIREILRYVYISLVRYREGYVYRCMENVRMKIIYKLPCSSFHAASSFHFHERISRVVSKRVWVQIWTNHKEIGFEAFRGAKRNFFHCQMGKRLLFRRFLFPITYLGLGHVKPRSFWNFRGKCWKWWFANFYILIWFWEVNELLKFIEIHN